MSAKLSASDDFDFVDRTRKMRRRITLELKMEVLRRIEAGERQADVSRSFGIPESSIRTIWKNADAVRIRSVFAPSLLAKQLTRFRSNLVERMEVMLSEWIDDQPDCGNIPLSVVMGRARSIFNYLKEDAGPRCAQEQFTASRGWYHRFKRRMSLRVMTGQEGRGGQFGCRTSAQQQPPEIVEGGSNSHSNGVGKIEDSRDYNESGVYPPPLECKIGGMDVMNGDDAVNSDDDDSQDDDIALATLQKQIEVPQPLGVKQEPSTSQQQLDNPTSSSAELPTPQQELHHQTTSLTQEVIGEGLSKIYDALELFAKNDPDWYRSTEVKANVLNSVFCYSIMWQQKQKQEVHGSVAANSTQL